MSRRTLALLMIAQDDDIKLQSRDSTSYQFISDTMSNLSFGFGSREISYHERWFKPASLFVERVVNFLIDVLHGCVINYVIKPQTWWFVKKWNYEIVDTSQSSSLKYFFNANDLCQKVNFDKEKVFSQIRQNRIWQLRIIFRVVRRLQRNSA